MRLPTPQFNLLGQVGITAGVEYTVVAVSAGAAALQWLPHKLGRWGVTVAATLARRQCAGVPQPLLLSLAVPLQFLAQIIATAKQDLTFAFTKAQYFGIYACGCWRGCARPLV